MTILIKDNDASVVAAAVTVMLSICPTNIGVLHKQFRKMVKMMRSCNETDQKVLINVLCRYSRLYLKNPCGVERSLWDVDFELFVVECEYLLCSRDPGVVLRIVELFYNVKNEILMKKGCRAMIRLLSRPTFESIMLLSSILEFCKIDARPWQEFSTNFYCYSNDRQDIISFKLEILELIATEKNCEQIESEFECYTKSSNEFLACKTVRVWRRLAVKFEKVADQSLLAMVLLLSMKNAELVGEVIVSIRMLLQENKLKSTSVSHEHLIAYLVSIYAKISAPLAKASILWLIGHHPRFKYASDALRIAMKTFAKEESIVKKQILTVSLLIYLQNSNSANEKMAQFGKLAMEYCLKLAKFDRDYDVRDHGRIVEGLSILAYTRSNYAERMIKILTQNSITADEVLVTSNCGC